jgi:hypothetical protein
MMIRYKIKVDFCVEDGGESSSDWQPINFSICREFTELIQHAIDEWLSINPMQKHTIYEVIFAYTVVRDGGGGVIGDYFEPIYTETQSM